MSNIKRKKGVSLYVAILVLAVLTSIALGLNALVNTQLKMVREIGNSVIALQAADSGVETALFCLYRPEENCPHCLLSSEINFNCSGTVAEASFKTEVVPAGSENCPLSHFSFYCIISTGTYKETSRVITAGD